MLDSRVSDAVVLPVTASQTTMLHGAAFLTWRHYHPHYKHERLTSRYRESQMREILRKPTRTASQMTERPKRIQANATTHCICQRS